MNHKSTLVRSLSVAGVLLALFAGFCNPVGSATAQSPYVVPMIVSLTGYMGFQGSTESRLMQAFERYINSHGGIHGQPLHFVMHDDQSITQTSVQLATEIIASKAPVFLGPSSAAGCNAVEPLVHEGPVMFCFSPSFHPAAGSYAFSAGTSTQTNVGAMVRYFRGRGMHKLALITSIDASGQDADRWFKYTFDLPENKDVRVVATEHFGPNDISLSAQFAHIKQSGAQAILAWSPGTPFINIIHAYSDAGLDVPVGTSSANMTYATMRQIMNFNNGNLYFVGARYFERKTLRPGPLKDQVDAFYGSLPSDLKADAMATATWDPGLLIVAALEKFGSAASATQIRDYILGLHSFVGINGLYDFSDGSQRGLDDSSATIMLWKSKTAEWVPVSRPGGAPIAFHSPDPEGNAP